MVDKGEMKGDTIEMVDWARPLAFQDLYQKITDSTQRGAQFVRTADRELVLPVRFRSEDNVPIDLGHYIPVKNFFGHYLETLTISHKDDMKPIVRPRP